MLRSLVRVLAWVVSVVLRVAFVLAVVVFAAGFALSGFDLPTDTTELSEAVDDASGIDIGTFDGAVGATNTSGTVNDTHVPSSNAGELNGTKLEYLIHEEVNEERTERGLSKLEFDTELRAVARYHSTDMAERDYFSHVGPEGETLADRYQKFDYRCRVRMDLFQYATGGENILYTYYDAPVATDHGIVRYESPEKLARGIVDGWMNSTPHRKNLLKPYWNREAIGVYIEQADGRTRVYATQNFC